MTLFDLLVIAVIAFSIGFAYVRGALREVGTLLVLGLAAAAAYFLAGPLQNLFGLSASFLATALTAAVIGMVSFIILYIGLHMALARAPLPASAVRIDRIAGGVFGFARGLVLIGLGFLAYSYYLDTSRQPDSVKNALTLPLAAAMANVFEGFAPPETELNRDQQPTEKTLSNAAVDGYARQDRSALSEIVTTVTTDGVAPAAPKQDDADMNSSDDPIADVIARESEPQ